MGEKGNPMNPMTVSDQIIAFLWDYGVRRIHGVVGGMSMYLNDAVAKHGEMKWIAHHGEQYAGYAAVGAAKFTGKLAVAMTTAGCGATNIITPVLTAFQDSVPLLVISGADRIDRQDRFGMARQRGIQGCPIREIAAHVTKATAELAGERQLNFTMRRLIHAATTGRPGPAWLIVPLDVQSLETG